MLERIPEKEAMDDYEENRAYNLLSRQYLSKWGYQEVWKTLYRNNVTSGRIIDLGIGTGWLSIELQNHSQEFQIYGVDVSKVMLALAEENINKYGKASAISLIEADVKRLPFEDNFFDAAVSFASLHHWGSLTDIFQEIHRVVKNGGLIAIQDLKRDARSLIFLKAIPSVIFRRNFEASVKASYTIPEINQILRERQITKKWRVTANALGFGIEGRIIK